MVYAAVFLIGVGVAAAASLYLFQKRPTPLLSPARWALSPLYLLTFLFFIAFLLNSMLVPSVYWLSQSTAHMTHSEANSNGKIFSHLEEFE
jgi:hypothetical protein